MFWKWFWDLYFETFGPIQPCPKCKLWPAKNCGYLEYDCYSGDYECNADDEDGEFDFDCDQCKYLICCN